VIAFERMKKKKVAFAFILVLNEVGIIARFVKMFISDLILNVKTVLLKRRLR
jgi:hypothetical protein